jgi:hypothetical protein
LVLVHNGARIAIGSLAASIVYGVFIYVHPIPLAIQGAITLALYAVLIPSVIGLMKHSRRLCERCVQSMPLDASAQAQRKERHLRVTHALDRRRRLYFVAVIAIVAVLFLGPGGLFAVVLTVAFQLGGIEVIYSAMLHSRLQPWCPWCGERGIERTERRPNINPVWA